MSNLVHSHSSELNLDFQNKILWSNVHPHLSCFYVATWGQFSFTLMRHVQELDKTGFSPLYAT